MLDVVLEACLPLLTVDTVREDRIGKFVYACNYVQKKWHQSLISESYDSPSQ